MALITQKKNKNWRREKKGYLPSPYDVSASVQPFWYKVMWIRVLEKKNCLNW